MKSDFEKLLEKHESVSRKNLFDSSELKPAT